MLCSCCSVPQHANSPLPSLLHDPTFNWKHSSHKRSPTITIPLHTQWMLLTRQPCQHKPPLVLCGPWQTSVVCHQCSAGTVRPSDPDAGSFPAAAVGRNASGGSDGPLWVDVRNDTVRDLILQVGAPAAPDMGHLG